MGVGQIALYLMAIVYVSFYVRRRIGQRAWRLLHYATFFAFLGATGHGLMTGSDSSAPWAFWTYVVAGLAVMFLFGYRVTLGDLLAAGARRRPCEIPHDAQTVRQGAPRRLKFRWQPWFPPSLPPTTWRPFT